MKGSPIVHQKEGINPWISYQIRQVMRRNNCINGILTGDPGSGKSFAMLSMAEAICKARGEEFKLEGNLFFKAADMMREIKRYYENPGAKKGKLWLFDEAGIDANNLNFHDQINRGLNAFFQTARHRNYIFWMTVPHFGFVSKGVRNLMTSHFQANGWIPKENLTKIVPRVLQYNGNNDKLYRKRILIKDLNGNMGYCNEIQLPSPSKRIVKEYEKLKKEFTGDLFSEIANKIEAQEQEKESKAMGKELTDKQREIVELLKRGRTPEMIATIRGISPQAVRQAIVLIKKKGFKIKSHKDDDGNTEYEVIEPGI
jgi:hypothetical protein